MGFGVGVGEIPPDGACVGFRVGFTPPKRVLNRPLKPSRMCWWQSNYLRSAIASGRNVLYSIIVMPILRDLKILTPNQRNAVLASFLGWTLDAFDFFIIVFVLKDIAKEFHTDIPSVTATLFLTLADRKSVV